jgi:hypothetical protein
MGLRRRPPGQWRAPQFSCGMPQQSSGSWAPGQGAAAAAAAGAGGRGLLPAGSAAPRTSTTVAYSGSRQAGTQPSRGTTASVQVVPYTCSTVSCGRAGGGGGRQLPHAAGLCGVARGGGGGGGGLGLAPAAAGSTAHQAQCSAGRHRARRSPRCCAACRWCQPARRGTSRWWRGRRQAASACSCSPCA